MGFISQKSERSHLNIHFNKTIEENKDKNLLNRNKCNDILVNKTPAIYLSFFDLIIGPRIFATYAPIRTLNTSTEINNNFDTERECEFIRHFFDLHQKGDFFTHVFKGLLAFNYIFELKNRSIRGGSRLFMITTVYPYEILNRKVAFFFYYHSIKDVFEQWANESVPILNKLLRESRIDGDRKLYNKPFYHSVVELLKKFLNEIEFLFGVIPDISEMENGFILKSFKTMKSK